MGAKRKIQYGGQPVDSEEVEFEPLAERWNEYRLSDGSLLKMKLVVTRVIRLDLYNEQGEPIYLVNSNNVISASVPPQLMKNR